LVKFYLDNAHSEYQPKIESILRGLLSRYPFVKLKAVHIFEPNEDDKSLGNASTPGEIALNAFWFSRDPKLLGHAALKDVIVDVNGRRIAWHGALFIEPEHVLTHEFGHILSEKLPGWEEWTTPRWRAATANPQLAPSGYALSKDVDEFFAEEFALFELGFAGKAQTEEFERLLKGY